MYVCTYATCILCSSNVFGFFFFSFTTFPPEQTVFMPVLAIVVLQLRIDIYFVSFLFFCFSMLCSIVCTWNKR